MKKIISITTFVVLLLFFFISVSVVWVPDIFTNARHIIGSINLADGNSFQIVQYWNHVDFYSTELHHRKPDGSMEIIPLDGDDKKRWKLPVTVDEQKKIVTVTSSGNCLWIVPY
ncbi:MAG: hypothetical protein WC701_05235 [Kiritimatiellales bacterium]|jgi:hypothetical protein